jgi:hypothetical protein
MSCHDTETRCVHTPLEYFPKKKVIYPKCIENIELNIENVKNINADSAYFSRACFFRKTEIYTLLLLKYNETVSLSDTASTVTPLK